MTLPVEGPPRPSTQPEASRKAKQRLLRLTPDVDASLVALAATLGMSVSETVSKLVIASSAFLGAIPEGAGPPDA